MLIVQSALGSPGASTTALYLAAQWATTGTEVLLVEADPGGGSLGHHLGIHFTPGSASFVASGLPIGGGNLIDHSQDVLSSNLHVMPSTASPSGAREIARWLDERAEALRDVSASEVAVIIDAGRMSGGASGANLRSLATAVVVVARGDSSPASLERIGSLLANEVRGEEVDRCVVTIGDSPLSAEEWRERCGVRFCGSVGLFAEVKGDLTAFLNRNKRKAKSWRLSLEDVAGTLLPYTKAPTTGAVASQRLAQVPEAAAVTEAVPDLAGPAGDVVGAGGGEAQQPVPVATARGESAPQFPEAAQAVPAETWAGVASPTAQLPPPFNTAEHAYWQPAPDHPQPASPEPARPVSPEPSQPASLEPPRPSPEEFSAGAHPPPSYMPPPAAPPLQERPPPAAPPLQERPPQPDVGPSGSFRDWAARLHGSTPHPNAGAEA